MPEKNPVPTRVERQAERLIVEQETATQQSILETLVTSFQRSLLARDVSKHTLLMYMAGVRDLVAYLRAHNLPLDPSAISREHVELFMRHFITTPTSRTGVPPASTTVLGKYRVLKLFFNWLVSMDEIPRSPMERMTAPRLSETLRPVLTDDQVRALLKTCEGKSFKDRRDYALFLLFVDTGLRLMEMTSLLLEDIDWANQSIAIRKGKGRKARVVYFGKRALKALDQYVYLKGGRRDHRYAGSPRLWLGKRGPLTDAGISSIVSEHGQEAGIPDIHPHLWRHYFIHASLRAGAQLGDIMRQTGHTKVEMLLHYGASAADERARESHRRLGPGDNL